MVNYCFFVMNVAQEQIIPLVNLVNEICEIGFLPEDKYVGDWLTEPREFLDDKSITFEGVDGQFSFENNLIKRKLNILKINSGKAELLSKVN